MLDQGCLMQIWLSEAPSPEDLYYYYLELLRNTNVRADQWILVVGEGALYERVLESISGLNFVSCNIHQDISNIINRYDVGVLLTTYTDSESVHKLIQIVYDLGHIGDIQFIYKIDQARVLRVLRQHNGVSKNRCFLDPSFPYTKFEEIFEGSLSIFTHRTQVRDAMDFTYYLNKVSHVSGDILELGSYEGHSGYILSRFQEEVCERKCSAPHKKVFLCDTFEGFPEENLAIDYVWNNTHDVVFDEVKRKFNNISNVELVKGDIRQTLPALLQYNRFSLVYIDLDSFAATEYALQAVYNNVNQGGVIICQDYGKEHCIGARLAVDNFIRKVNCISVFSFFSGVKIILKLTD